MEKLYQAEVDKKKKPQGPQDEMRKKVSFEPNLHPQTIKKLFLSCQMPHTFNPQLKYVITLKIKYYDFLQQNCKFYITSGLI